MTGVQQTQRTSGVGVAVTALCLVQFVDVLGVTVVVTALPDMLASLHAPGSYATLIATGYAMFFGSLLMFGRGWVTDSATAARSSCACWCLPTEQSWATASSVVALMAGRCLRK